MPTHCIPSPSRCWTFHRNLVAKTITGVLLILWRIRNNLRKMSTYTHTHNTESTIHQISSVQSLSRVQLFVTPWTSARQASLSIIDSRSVLKLMSTESVMPFNHPILSPPSPFALNFPQHLCSVFSSGSVLHIRWPKYQSFSFSISLSSGYSGLISFRMDWLDLLAIQRTLKSLLQHHYSKAAIL